VLAARPGISLLVDDAPVPRLPVTGLSAGEAERLVTERAATTPERGVLHKIVGGAAGNPLALIELAGALTTEQLAGRQPLPDPLPVGRHLETALLRPLDGLPDTTLQALLLASADDGRAGLLGGALTEMGLSMTALEPAERAGVVVVGPTRVAFSHPLVRAAVYHAAAAPDRRAAHLALAAAGPDEATAAELEQAAGSAAARTGHAAACEAMEAAARLSPSLTEMGRSCRFRGSVT